MAAVSIKVPLRCLYGMVGILGILTNCVQIHIWGFAFTVGLSGCFALILCGWRVFCSQFCGQFTFVTALLVGL